MPSRDAARRARARSSRRRSATTRPGRSRRRARAGCRATRGATHYAELREQLDALGRRLGGDYRVLVDENQHVDREAAARAGVGFYGKNTMLITRRHGSWVVLGTLVTDVELEPTPPLDARLRLVHALHRRVPDRRARRARRRSTRRRASRTGRRRRRRSPSEYRTELGRPRLRLRHLPGRLPLEPRRREAARRGAAPTDARAARLARRLARARRRRARRGARPPLRPPQRPALAAPERARRRRQRRQRAPRAQRAPVRRTTPMRCSATRHAGRCDGWPSARSDGGLDAERLAVLVHEVRSPVAALSAVAEAGRRRARCRSVASRAHAARARGPPTRSSESSWTSPLHPFTWYGSTLRRSRTTPPTCLFAERAWWPRASNVRSSWTPIPCGSGRCSTTSS